MKILNDTMNWCFFPLCLIIIPSAQLLGEIAEEMREDYFLILPTFMKGSFTICLQVSHSYHTNLNPLAIKIIFPPQSLHLIIGFLCFIKLIV